MTCISNRYSILSSDPQQSSEHQFDGKTAHYVPNTTNDACILMTYELQPKGIFQNELKMHSLCRQAKLQNISNNGGMHSV